MAAVQKRYTGDLVSGSRRRLTYLHKQPVSTTRLRQIAEDACTATLSSAPTYNHSQTPTWNSTIISRILESLLASAQTSTGTSAQYKYAVNSTIIQHLEPSSVKGAAAGTQTISPPSTPAPSGASDDAAVQPPEEAAEEVNAGPNGAGVAPQKGRRGMHSATGAYWNNDTDGMWSYKYDGGEAKGMDVVISVIWIAV